MAWTCACCLKTLPDRAIEWVAVSEEGEEVSVGSDCGKKIKDAGAEGHTHENTGVTLYSLAAYADMADG